MKSTGLVEFSHTLSRPILAQQQQLNLWKNRSTAKHIRIHWGCVSSSNIFVAKVMPHMIPISRPGLYMATLSVNRWNIRHNPILIINFLSETFSTHQCKPFSNLDLYIVSDCTVVFRSDRWVFSVNIPSIPQIRVCTSIMSSYASELHKI